MSFSFVSSGGGAPPLGYVVLARTPAEGSIRANLRAMASSQYAMAPRRIVVFLGLAAALLGCASSGAAAEPAPVRVLFVGNSLQEWNDLPGRVAELAAAAGRRLEYEAVTLGGCSLEDHFGPGETPQRRSPPAAGTS